LCRVVHRSLLYILHDVFFPGPGLLKGWVSFETGPLFNCSSSLRTRQPQSVNSGEFSKTRFRDIDLWCGIQGNWISGQPLTEATSPQTT